MHDATQALCAQPRLRADHHLRFRAPRARLSSVFSDDWFALKAEAFARFFGTPTFLVTQTAALSLIRAKQFTPGATHVDDL
jgi:uncharacterized membrane protein